MEIRRLLNTVISARSSGDSSHQINISDNAIEVAGLCVVRGEQNVIDGLDLQVGRSEVLAVTGPSGVGKTTLLGALCGLVVPSSGSIRVLGEEMVGRDDRYRARIRRTSFGVVFQGDELLPELTLVENVSLALRLSQPRLSSTEYRGLAIPVLQRLDVAELADRFPYQVSGGQLQRAAIARAVVTRPAIVLADEPTEALDSATASSALRVLIDLAREQQTTVVVVTHDRAIADACDRQWNVAQDGLLGWSTR